MTQHVQPDLRELHGALRALESRRRVLTAARGVGAWLAIVLPAAAAVGAIDWYSHIPLLVRLPVTAGLIAIAVWAARRFVRPAFAKARAVDDTALAVERTFPDSADRVISAVQLERHPGDPGYGSAELVAATQRQALDWAKDAAFRRAEPLARFLPAILLGVLCLAGAIALTGAAPRVVSAWLIRCVWQHDFPHRTHIDDYPKSMLVARGEPATIVVRASGVLLPGAGKIRVRSAKGAAVAADLLRDPRATRRGEYVARIEAVVEPLTFTVELGDAPPVRGEIRVADRPDLGDIHLTLTYPAYVGGRQERLNTGHVRALPGSKVKVSITPSKPLTSASIAFDDRTTLDMREQPMFGVATYHPWVAEFDIAADAKAAELLQQPDLHPDVPCRGGGYTINLTDRDGLTNAEPVRYKLAALADGWPRIAVIRPGPETLATPFSRLTIEYKISDDFGLRRARLLFRTKAENAATQPDFQAIPLPLPGLSASRPDADLPAPGPQRADQSLLWDLSPLGFKVGDVIEYKIVGDDFADRPADRRAKTQLREIHVKDEAAITRQLQEQWQAAIQQIERSAALMQESQQRVRQIEREITTRPEATTRKDRGR